MVLYFLLIIICHRFFLQAEVNMSRYLNMFLVVVVAAAGCIFFRSPSTKTGYQNVQTNDVCDLETLKHTRMR